MTDLTLYYTASDKVSEYAQAVIVAATDFVTGGKEVEFEPQDAPGEHTLNFGGTSPLGTHTLSPRQMAYTPNAPSIVAAAIANHLGLMVPRGPIENEAETLYLDIESGSVEDMWDVPLKDYFKMGQYAWGPEGDVTLTYDYEEVLYHMARAAMTIAHQGHQFDFSVLLRNKALDYSLRNALWDSKVHAATRFTAPHTYEMRTGQWKKDADKPEAAAHGWLSLDNLAFYFGVPGKIGDLHALAKKYGGFAEIDVLDEEYREYGRQDVRVLQGLTSSMLYVDQVSEYDWREQLNAAIDAQNTRNGFRVDLDRAEALSLRAQKRRTVLLDRMVEQYQFPTEGKKPWASKVGKRAILDLLADNGIVPSEIPDWPLTETKNISLGGKALIAGTKDTEAEETGQMLAELMGMRGLADLAIESTRLDGYVHPEITAYQRSGRKSTTKPGLTVWTSKGPGAVEKSYFIADPGCSLVEFDYSQADARIVAAYSGDANYALLFAPGADMHEVRARTVFGDLAYDENPTKYRNDIKPVNHGGNYGLGPTKLAKMLRVPVSVARALLEKDDAAYADVTEWKNRVREEAKSGEVVNAWGRRMPISPGRGHTQGPALYGQSGTREIMVDALIRMLHYDVRLILWLKAQIHDALVFSIPDEHLHWAVPKIQELMATTFMGVEFVAAHGKPAHNWQEAAHG